MNLIERRIADNRAAFSDEEESLFGVTIEPMGSPVLGRCQGREVILAGTNNYLGLTYHPELMQAAEAALHDHGTGTTGSRMANGTLPHHVALEDALKKFYDAPSALAFTTGFQANLGVIAGLCDRDGVLLLDADCHASIYDGAALSGATVYRFRHNDVADLERKLKRLQDQAGNVLVIVEGIYSMLGDTAPLAEICDVVQSYGVALMVDEAHSFGVLGATGRGLAQECGVEDQVDVVVGTFSKSAACVGGFCVSRKHDFSLLRRDMRAFVFSASLPPSVVATATAALGVMAAEPERRKNLWHNAERLYGALANMGLEVGPEISPIVAVTLNDPEGAVTAWHGLLDKGVYVNLVVPPAAPDGKSLLRCSLSAAHTDEHVNQMIDAYRSIVA